MEDSNNELSDSKEKTLEDELLQIVKELIKYAICYMLKPS